MCTHFIVYSDEKERSAGKEMGMGIGRNGHRSKFFKPFFFFLDFFIITRNLRLSYSMSLFFRGKVHDPVYYELQDLTAERFTIFWSIEVVLVSLPLTLNIFLSLFWYFYCWLWASTWLLTVSRDFKESCLLHFLRFKTLSNTKIWFSGCVFEHGLLN